MAVDSKNKRASAIFPLLPFRALLPEPDGTISQADRQAIVFIYSGIAATVVIIPTVDGTVMGANSTGTVQSPHLTGTVVGMLSTGTVVTKR